MAVVHLTSLDIFNAPLTYHQNVSLFLQKATNELQERSSAITNELKLHNSEYASQLSGMVAKLGQRLSSEGQAHHGAVDYLNSHYQFLVQSEASLSGSSVVSVSLPQLPDIVPNWLHIIPSGIHGCFGEFKSLLNTYQHELYKGDQTLRDMEQLLWNASHHPESFDIHADWSGNAFADGASAVVNTVTDNTVNKGIETALEFVREHEGELRNVIDTVRKGIECVALPLADGEKVQEFLDYVDALERAYRDHVHEPFQPTAQAFAANYQPPEGATSYHDSLATVANQQDVTLGALRSLRSQVQIIQTANENLTIQQVSLITSCAIILIAVAAIVIFFPDIVVSGATIIWRASLAAGELLGIPAIWASITQAFGVIVAIVATDTFWWVLGAVALSGVITIVWAKGGKQNITDNGVINQLKEYFGNLGKTYEKATEEEICKALESLYKVAKGAARLPIKATQKALKCRHYGGEY
jgi:hypothetical protein